jgi:hypothetical protein
MALSQILRLSESWLYAGIPPNPASFARRVWRNACVKTHFPAYTMRENAPVLRSSKTFSGSHPA